MLLCLARATDPTKRHSTRGSPVYEAAAEVVGVDAVNSEAADVVTLEDAGEGAGVAEADPTADRQQWELSN